MSGDNEGVLFKNEKKREGKHDADYQGNITIEGKEYWLNSWINTSKDGNKKYMAIKAMLKQPKVSSNIFDEVEKVFPGATALDDEIPF